MPRRRILTTGGRQRWNERCCSPASAGRACNWRRPRWGSPPRRSRLEVMVFGSYGGTMRGGYTASTVVVGDEPLQTPPEVDDAWAALAMHHDFWPAERDRLRAGGIVVVDSSVFRGDVGAADCTVLPVPATELAADAGFAQAGAMVALGAFAAATRHRHPRLPRRRRPPGAAELPGAARGEERPRPHRRLGARARAPRRRPGPSIGGLPDDRALRARPRHGGDRRRGLQGLRALHRRVPARRAADDDHHVNARWLPLPASCCRAAPPVTRAPRSARTSSSRCGSTTNRSRSRGPTATPRSRSREVS